MGNDKERFNMKLKQYLNESLETDIQRIINTISKEHKISTVKIKFTNKQLSGGDAYYHHSRVKGMKKITPINITIGEWKAIKEYPDEWQHRLAHELAHHILAQTQSTLRHSKKHDTLTDKIESKIRKSTKVKDKDLFKGQDPDEWLKDYIKKL